MTTTLGPLPPAESWFTTKNIIIAEWVTTIAVFLGCFIYLANKIDRQSERSDELYKLYVETNKNLSDYRKDADTKFYDLLKDSRTPIVGK